jgi:hypothetical protein
VAIFTNTFEGGTAGAAITTGNSGGASGTAFSAVSANFLYYNDTPAHGSMCGGVNNPGTTTFLGRWATGSTETVFAGRIYFRLSLATTTTLDLFEVRAPDDSTYLARIRMNGSNKLQAVDSAGTFPWTSTATLPVDTYYCASIYVTTGTTTANGTVRLAYRALGDTAWIEDSGTVTGNLGAGLQSGNCRIGKTSNASYTGNLRVDSLEVRTGADATGLILPFGESAVGGWQLGSIAMG